MSAAPVIYVTAPGEYRPEDALDIRYLEASEDHQLLGIATDTASLQDLLEHASVSVNLVVVESYGAVSQVLTEDRARFREKVARVFLVGGQAGDFLPTDPRLAERHQEYFQDTEPRLREPEAFSQLLASGEAVIWLPRDICLWRCDVMDLTRGVVLLSALPAFLLARRPDPLPWLRLFRTIPVQVGSEKGRLTFLEPSRPPPMPTW
ncbi:MAG: hypothetical protein QM758_24160 [Armatimonas sp.]